MFTATDWIRDKNGLMVLTPFPIKWAGKAAKQVYHKLRQKDTGNEATSRTFLQRKGSVSVQPLSLTSFDSSPSRGASGEEEKFSAMPKPPLQGATATTAASGGNREELLGPRPAGCERQRSRRWEPQPGQWHRVSDDGEVVLRQSLPFVGKSGSRHRFLYLFVEVYDIMSLRSIPAILMGKGVTLWPIF